MKFVTLCAEDLATKLKTVLTLEKKTLTVYSLDDLVSILGNTVKPAVGIMYEGTRRNDAGGGKQVGVSMEIVFSLLLITETSVISPRIDAMSPAHDTLDLMREAIHGSRSPTGHFWSFQVEAPASQKGNVTVWVQRWACPVQVPPVHALG